VEKAGASLQAASSSSSGSSNDGSITGSVSTSTPVCTSNTHPATVTSVSAAVTSTLEAVRNVKNEVRKSSSLADIDVRFTSPMCLVVGYCTLITMLLLLQGVHKPGKPGILRDFSEHGKIREFSGNFVQPQGKIVTNKLFLVHRSNIWSECGGGLLYCWS